MSKTILYLIEAIKYDEMQLVIGTEMVFGLEKYQAMQMYDRTIVKESFAIQARYKQLPVGDVIQFG